jgi:hypothetical protein
MQDMLSRMYSMHKFHSMLRVQAWLLSCEQYMHGLLSRMCYMQFHSMLWVLCRLLHFKEYMQGMLGWMYNMHKFHSLPRVQFGLLAYQ